MWTVFLEDSDFKWLVRNRIRKILEVLVSHRFGIMSYRKKSFNLALFHYITAIYFVA